MNLFLQNIIDQIKEAQIKLGYERETMRFYYMPATLQTLLHTEIATAEELCRFLETSDEYKDCVLGTLTFSVHAGRIEVLVPLEGAEYVGTKVTASPFLKEIILLFSKHHIGIEDVKEVFAHYNENYICKQMPEGSDFDYVLYFQDGQVDVYYYCVKQEMGHLIYHRFLKKDYELLIAE